MDQFKSAAKADCVARALAGGQSASARAMAALCAIAIAVVSLGAAAKQDKGYGVETISTHADRVSGGDVLVKITYKHDNRNHPLDITLNGRDVSGAFQPGDDANTLVGLVTGLAVGKNKLRVQGNGSSGIKDETLEITNYPIRGPIISGPHEVPYICQTSSFRLPDGTFLGAPLDANCSVTTRVDYVYMSTAGGAFKPMPSTAVLPADVAMTTTTKGVTVPFVVRVETGTINRGIYQNAILHDPTKEVAPNWYTPPKGWNKRLIAVHGVGCPGGWYVQGAALGVSVLNTTRLAEGYALFNNTLRHPSNSCNPFLAGETTMMDKEHFIETFGVPDYTVSMGNSGGAYTSLDVGDAFPGLFDAVFIRQIFPDALSIALDGEDGHLLTHYFTFVDPTGFTDAQKVAVTGYQGVQAWIDAANQSQRTDPVPGRVDIPGYSSAVWDAAVPAALRYSPTTNPGGARPTVFDVSRNIYGVNPVTGFALRAYDNVGVQYGLKALNAGAITTTQFLNLNEFVGGIDQDSNYIANRTVGDGGAIRRAQQSGISLYAGAGLASIPIFDYGTYNDARSYHYQWYHFALRERLKQANGNADNMVLWRGNTVPAETAWAAFIRWVEAVNADSTDATQREKAINNRPVDVVDGCYDQSTPAQFIAEPQTWSSQPNSQCNTLWPSYSSSRKVAGGPLAANILKCQLKPIDLNDYAVSFSSAEINRLHAIFPQGVCDWSKPGVNQTGVVPWASFGPAPENLVFDVTKP